MFCVYSKHSDVAKDFQICYHPDLLWLIEVALMGGVHNQSGFLSIAESVWVMMLVKGFILILGCRLLRILGFQLPKVCSDSSLLLR